MIKRKNLELIALMLCLMLVLGILGGCVDTVVPEKVDKSDTHGTGTPVTSSNVDTEAFKEVAKIFNIGDTVRMGNLEYTINFAYWGEGSLFVEPDEGEKWLIIDCTIKNTGDKPAGLSSLLMFKLYDEESYARDMSIFATTKGSLDGEVGVNRKLRGQIAYSVDEDQSQWELIFEPNMFGFGQAVYLIKVDEVGIIPEHGEEIANMNTDGSFTIGETVKMGNIEFTVNSARWDKGGDFSKPEEGTKWLVADCTIENIDTEPLGVSSLLMFRLYDELAYAKDLSIFATTKGSLDGEVGAGRKIRGEIAFSVGADQKIWELIFEPNLLGFGQAIFLIKAEDVN